MDQTAENQRRQVARINGAAIPLCLFGLSPIIGYLTGIQWLHGIGAASTRASVPEVFSDVAGVETFASNFVLKYAYPDGTPSRLTITPEIYSQLKGLYNRRNVYGAALSYGPTQNFSKPIFEATFCYGLNDPAPLRGELGLPAGITDIRLRVRTKTKGRNAAWLLPGARH